VKSKKKRQLPGRNSTHLNLETTYCQEIRAQRKIKETRSKMTKISQKLLINNRSQRNYCGKARLEEN
jgi:hypothetical protein